MAAEMTTSFLDSSNRANVFDDGVLAPPTLSPLHLSPHFLHLSSVHQNSHQSSSKITSSNGSTAIAIELLANIVSLPSLLSNPDHALSFLVRDPAQITPATRTLAQWFGGLIAGLTVPLAMSYATPAPGPAGNAQRGFRRATYLALAGPEVVFAVMMGGAWLKGADVGMKETALLGGAINMIAFAVVRSVFLFWKPHLLEERDVKKTA
ncbi:hypothetical protein BST61_g6421 [Cercospora zeina]